MRSNSEELKEPREHNKLLVTKGWEDDGEWGLSVKKRRAFYEEKKKAGEEKLQ